MEETSAQLGCRGLFSTPFKVNLSVRHEVLISIVLDSTVIYHDKD